MVRTGPSGNRLTGNVFSGKISSGKDTRPIRETTVYRSKSKVVRNRTEFWTFFRPPKF